MTSFTGASDEAISEFARAFNGPNTQDRPFALPLPENAIQRAVIKHLRTRGAPNTFAFHPRNGGHDQRGRRAGINSGLGVVSGVPDIIILTPGQCYALELKTEKGKLSPQQTETMVRMGHCGAITGVAYGLDDALRWLEKNGLLKGAAA
jgi:hypothetical protein